MPVRPETSKRQNRFKIERNMLEEEVVKKFYGENELRRMYLEFFESKGHLKMNSFSLVPHNDNSLLLINAGMATFPLVIILSMKRLHGPGSF